VKNNLGLSPKSGWSIDPFGHGSTVPYLLKMSGISSTIIQRIHYAWKQWLAERQMGDFLWRQNWDSDGHTDLLTHNQPFDIYSIKHSCGPHPQVCLNFDFRKIPGNYFIIDIWNARSGDNNACVVLYWYRSQVSA
jgi:alpha-mannosidase